jgi:DNA-binding MarR family transcriptional regulator
VSSTVAGVAAELHALAIAILRFARREDGRLGLTPARLSALSVLAFGGDATLGELAAAEHVSLPTMTRVAASLVSQGLALRCTDSGDRRFVRLRITSKGRALMQRGRELRVARLQSRLGDLGEDDLAAFRRVFAILREVL